jgi:plastocyanin
MKRIAFTALALLTLATFAACSRIKIVPQDEAHMGGAAFKNTSVTVKAGAPVKFIDDADGATHILVMGTNGAWTKTDGSPDQLNNATGITINPGQEIDIAFPTAGTYTVTCTIHQSMLLTVTVTP